MITIARAIPRRMTVAGGQFTNQTPLGPNAPAKSRFAAGSMLTEYPPVILIG
jgi:hypothetical protein